MPRHLLGLAPLELLHLPALDRLKQEVERTALPFAHVLQIHEKAQSVLHGLQHADHAALIVGLLGQIQISLQKNLSPGGGRFILQQSREDHGIRSAGIDEPDRIAAGVLVGVEGFGFGEQRPEGFGGEEAADRGVVPARAHLVEGAGVAVLAHAPGAGVGEGLGHGAGLRQDAAVGVVGVGRGDGLVGVDQGQRVAGGVEVVEIDRVGVFGIDHVEQPPAGGPDVVAQRGAGGGVGFGDERGAGDGGLVEEPVGAAVRRAGAELVEPVVGTDRAGGVGRSRRAVPRERTLRRGGHAAARVVGVAGGGNLRSGVVGQRRDGGFDVAGGIQRGEADHVGDAAGEVVGHFQIDLLAGLQASQLVEVVPGRRDDFSVGEGDRAQTAVVVVAEIELGAGQAVGDGRQTAGAAGVAVVLVVDGEGVVGVGRPFQAAGRVVDGEVGEAGVRFGEHAAFGVVGALDVVGRHDAAEGVALELEVGAGGVLDAQHAAVGVAGEAARFAAGMGDGRDLAVGVVGEERGAEKRIGDRLQPAHGGIGEGPVRAVEVGERRQLAQRVPGIGHGVGVRRPDAGRQPARIVGEGRGAFGGIGGGREPAARVVGAGAGLARRVGDADDAAEFVASEVRAAAQRRLQGGRRAVAVAFDAPGSRAEGEVGHEPLLVAGVGRAHAGGIGRGRQAADEIVLVRGGAAGAVHGVGEAPGRVVGKAVRAAEGVDDGRHPAVGVVFVAVRAAEGVDGGGQGAEFVVGVLDAGAAGPDGFNEPPGGVVAV